MRGLIWVPVLTLAWLGLGACFYVHDDDCASDADCHSGRVCQQGQCIERGEVENPNEGFGGTQSSGSGETSAANTTSQTTSEPPDDGGPSCSGINRGTQLASVTDGPSICQSASSSVTAVFGEGSLLERLDDRACTLTNVGFECGDTLADTYECGDCSFKVYLSEVYYEGEWVTVGWAISPTSCVSDGCADYCCTSDESGTAFTSLYWLPQTPPGATTASSTSSGSTTGACTGPCCECGFPFCDGDCAGCC